MGTSCFQHPHLTPGTRTQEKLAPKSHASICWNSEFFLHKLSQVDLAFLGIDYFSGLCWNIILTPFSLCRNSFGGYCPPFLHLKPSLHTPILFRFGLEDNKSVKNHIFLSAALHISLVSTFALASRKLSHVLNSIIETMLPVNIIVFAVAFPPISFSLSWVYHMLFLGKHKQLYW